jgi:hypothetical protein
MGLNHPAFAQDDDVKARYVITVCNDFVVDLYKNGDKVPERLRHNANELFGAEVEKDDIKVSTGDWLVFHVVSNAIRWNGVYFFAAAGMREKDDFGFFTDYKSDDWSSCDNPSDVDQFISDKNYMSDAKVHRIPEENLWRDGIPRIKAYTGDSWPGTPLWGHIGSRSVWLKVIVN